MVEAAPATLPRFAGPGIALVVAVQAALLLAMASAYGPHRDELYFASAGRRLAWGYPDQPALVPLLARVAGELAPDDLVALRLASIGAVCLTSWLAARFARLLGGPALAQVLTAAVVAGSAVIMTFGHRLTTATFDCLAWTALLLVWAHGLREERPRWWLVAGAVAGVGLHAKHGVAFLVLGILVATAVHRRARPVLRTPWPWLGGLVALLLWLPNLVWQARHDWPVLALSADISEEYGGVAGRVALVGELLVAFSPVIAVVWLAGLVALLRRPEWEWARPVGTAFLVTTGVFVATGGKGYYLAGAVPVLVAAGCVRLAARRPRPRSLAVAGAVLVASAAVAWPALVPVLPARTYATSFYADLESDQLETIGWPAYVAQVREVLGSLPRTERATAVVLTGNYGEAGALEWYGVGVPVYSGHNGWRFWGPPPEDAAPVVVVGFDPRDSFVGCRPAGRLRNDVGADNEEAGLPLWVCDRVSGSWSRRWPDLVHYDA